MVVTGADRAPRRPASPKVVLAIAFAVVLVVAVGGLLSYLAVTLIVMPFARSSALAAGLTARARAEYPGATFVALQTRVTTDTAESGPNRIVYISLTDPRHAGFRFTATYSAPASVTTDAAAFENLDDFFKAQASPRQPVDSFESTWMRNHARDTCEYVIETGNAYEATRTYQVGAFPAADGTSATGIRTTYFTYVVATDLWAETDSDPLEAASADATAPLDEPSVTDTATAVAAALPGFKATGVAQEPQGDWVAIVGNTRFPKVRLAVYVEYLDPTDTSDGMVTLFGRPSKRADAFARMWTARHPGTVIESLDFDPDYTGATDLVDVGYTPGPAADVGVALAVERFRYRPSSDSWVPVQ